MHGFWYCSSACFTAAAERELSILMRSMVKPTNQFHRMPLELSLVSRGLVTNAELRIALETQAKDGGEIGEVILRNGLLTEEQMTQARAAQWGCPAFFAAKYSARASVFIPPTLLRYYSAIPLHYVAATKVLLIGFVSAVEYDVLFAIEKMTGCKTQPCFITPSEFQEQMRNRQQFASEAGIPAGKEIALKRTKGAPAMAEVLCKYGVELEADDAIVGRCKDHIWARLTCGVRDIDLLFEVGL